MNREQCGPDAPDARLFGPGIVEGAEPLYRNVMGGPNGSEAHLAGAKVHVRPLPGVTPELLVRSLRCRSAQLVLGRAQETPNEPYWLPDGWVTVDVQSEDGAFVVILEGEDLEHSKEILARAKAFASVP